ncbi:hypothetical protein [Clostridium butyricum]|uniref:hypothetical protein n=1 Tax=Clostridium butyricum TaxID=1492 RepID=UPI000904069E|nr:hypothetical protein [Clostridium butyricum]APF22834.1 putative glycoprotein gp2 [Clostridium butyricum]
MLSVIKTAIITIIISFISGVLLDNYKNLAPKISCTMGKCVPIKMNNKKIRAYILKVKNISNKTLHDLTVNVQGHDNDLKMDDAQITGGLKFDICGEYNNFNVSIPFLSKNDEFSVKLFVDDVQGEHSKPVITLRSPENFKKIGHGEGNGLFPVLSDTSQKIGSLFSKKEKNDGINTQISRKEKSIFNKKILITTSSIISLVCIVFLATGLYKNISEKAQDKSVQSDTEQKSNSVDTPSNETAKNSSGNTSNNGKSESSSTKSSSKDGISNEVKTQVSSSYDSGQTSNNKDDKNSEENKNTSTSNTDVNKQTADEKNKDSSSSTSNNNTNKQSADDKANQSTKTSTPTNTTGNTKVNQSSTSSSSDTNVNSPSEKQQVSNSESSGN